MKITPIGSRGRIVSFPELDTTNVYLILAPQTTYLCDTFLGPEPMERIKTMLAAQGRTQPIVIFNSHKDWDHVWGNCAFPGGAIIATEQCAANMHTHFADEWSRFGEAAQGEVKPVYPNLLFTGRLLFPADGVLFFSTPGHTDGSGSCLDLKDKVLFVADNVEYPLPYIFSHDLESYTRTLQDCVALNPAGIVNGHGTVETMTLDLLRSTLAYVEALAAGAEPDKQGWDEQAHAVHQQNWGRIMGNE